MLDETELTRRIQRKNARMPEVDVKIKVSTTDDERARELADALADAIHERLEEPHA